MVAVKESTLAETYGSLCAFLRKFPQLTVHVVNHLAAKHKIHSLPAFHTTDAVTDADKSATYKELALALVAHAKGDKTALGKLKGQVANGQAADPKPEFKPEELTTRRDAVIPPRSDPDTPTAEAKPRVEIPEPKVEPPPAPKPKPVRNDDPITARLRELLIEVLGEMPASVDEDKVREIVTQHVSDQHAQQRDAIKALLADAMAETKASASGVQRLEIKIGEAIRPVDGAAHRQLGQVTTWLSAGVPLWLWGSAGAGKTHLARQCAAALGLKFHAAAIDETITVGKLTGFRNVANGDFVEGLVYRAFKDGGLLLLDEIDTNATAIAALNSLLANEHYTFPNGEDVARHKDFRILAGANTKGTGAVAGYTARVRLDAATLDRFAVIQLEYDAGLELELAAGLPNESVPWKPAKPADAQLCARYVHWVQKARETVGTSALISPRASYLGVRALMCGVPTHEVAEALVFKLMTPDTCERVRAAAGDPATL
jgi:hypothetical protein